MMRGPTTWGGARSAAARRRGRTSRSCVVDAGAHTQPVCCCCGVRGHCCSGTATSATATAAATATQQHLAQLCTELG